VTAGDRPGGRRSETAPLRALAAGDDAPPSCGPRGPVLQVAPWKAILGGWPVATIRDDKLTRN